MQMARAFVARHAAVDFDAAQPLPLIEHVFSHYRLHIEPLAWRHSPAASRVGDNDHVRWQPLDRLDDVGLPAPVRKLLEGLPR
jgi:A/G-specific adenine glycosylase